MSFFKESTNPLDPNGDEMAIFLRQNWEAYKVCPAWEAMFSRISVEIVEAMADSGATLGPATAALYELSVARNEEGPERYLAVGYEMAHRQEIAMGEAEEVIEIGQVWSIGADGRLAER